MVVRSSMSLMTTRIGGRLRVPSASRMSAGISTNAPPCSCRTPLKENAIASVAPKMRGNLSIDWRVAQVVPLGAAHAHELVRPFGTERVEQHLVLLELGQRFGESGRIAPNAARFAFGGIHIVWVGHDWLPRIEPAPHAVKSRRDDRTQCQVRVRRAIDRLDLDVRARL